MAVYGASKAFVLSFSEALWAEYRSKGIRVLALCPGPTSTDFFTVVGTEDASFGAKETPEKVAQVALRALERGRPSVISGRMNWLQAHSVRLAPRALVVSMGARLMRPGHSGG
jgi:short-subunit dehydrogenase